MANQFTPPSGAATTNHPAVIIALHVNTSAKTPSIVLIAHTITMNATTVILSKTKNPFIGHTVMADPIGHLPTSFLQPSSHIHQETTTS